MKRLVQTMVREEIDRLKDDIKKVDSEVSIGTCSRPEGTNVIGTSVDKDNLGVATKSFNDIPNVVGGFSVGDNTKSVIFHVFSQKPDYDTITMNGQEYVYLSFTRNNIPTFTWHGRTYNSTNMKNTAGKTLVVSVTTNNTWNNDIDVKLAQSINAGLKNKRWIVTASNASELSSLISSKGWPSYSNFQFVQIIDSIKNTEGSEAGNWSYLIELYCGSTITSALKSEITGGMKVECPVGCNLKANSSGPYYGEQVLIGIQNMAFGDHSVCIGKQLSVGSESVCVGNSNSIERYGIGIGYCNTTLPEYNISIGWLNRSEGFNTEGSGCIGKGLVSKDTSQECQYVFGNWNGINGTSSFIFGDGISNTSRKNLVTFESTGNNIDGKIMVRASSGSMFQGSIPKPPTSQGNYKLRCSVDSNGSPTYSWVADT